MSTLISMFSSPSTENRVTRQDENPFGENGIITQVAEHIPIVNNIAQEVHKINGREEAQRRAQERNPLGADGMVTQAFEHIPIICDGIEYLHRNNGNELSAERASARTLTRLFSKDGAVTKVAELLPGSNLVAAAVHAINGNHTQAERAVNLFDSWMTAGDPDGALAKVAELFPGTDLVAFALHMQSNQYAQALRCVTKTQFVNVEVETVFLWVNASKVKDIAVSSSEIRGVDANPRCLSLIVGLNDILTTYLETLEESAPTAPNFDRESSIEDIISSDGFIVPSPSSSSPSLKRYRDRGAKRRDRLSNNSRRVRDAETMREGSSHDFLIVGVGTEELVTDWANDFIRFVVDSMVHGIPVCLYWSIESVNKYTLPRWRRQLRYKLLFDKPLPQFDEAIIKAFQSTFPFMSITHSPFFESDCVKLPEPAPRSCLRRAVCPAATAATCISCGLACGLKAAGLACMGGIILGAGQFCRWLYRAAANRFNDYNQESWEAAALGIEADDNRGSRQASPEKPRPEKRWGVMLKFPEAGGVQIVDLIWEYIVKNIRCGCLLAPLFKCNRERLKAGVRCFAPEWQTVPFVMDLETGDIHLELDPEIWPNGLDLPNVRVAVLVDLGLTGDTPSQIRVAIPDTIVDEIVESLRVQVGKLDIRTLDPRLSGFTKPFLFDFKLRLEWPRYDKARVVFQELKAPLHLPQ